ncbi:MAG: hypothetical protein A2788_00520 [Candidatus Abawacabacteria bacterium RIFCSPHIGHO2_01_FULL_46_8]|uniref:O-methyltransferase C-terminal domain-containing protein n=1 Tax=Candidatus Abawacabacteria bacterium RIFCSPHIGHO2_01_FULL_46_8 TaxID=1817815 RepID=A0A1F4XMU4_9BACT|nr:MAG: hypothetical protein A2788_00520 [Candidatus Abawacabacteria bacterium RIFCSPHIGHO2_01_FULL_46_8]
MAIKKFIASSAGSQADLKARVNIAKVHGGYFSNLGAAQSFVNVGIKSIIKKLPRNIKLADYGGGQGFLTKIVADYLTSKKYKVTAFVVDANPEYLAVAKKDGLETHQCNLESCDFKDADLIIMRAVNHYNAIDKQLDILKNARQALKRGGFLVSQISSGSKDNCALRSKIVNLKSLGRAAAGESYHWTAMPEYSTLLKKAGFKNIAVAGYAPDCQWSPEEQWNRFHKKEAAAAKGDIKKIAAIDRRRKIFIKEAYAIIDEFIGKYKNDELGIIFNKNGKAIIQYQYPIITSQK